MDVTTVYAGVPTVHTFSGSQDVVNRNGASEPFGRGWQLAGLDQLVIQTGGALLVRDNGTTLWFAGDGQGGFLHAPGDASYASLAQNVDNSYTLSDTHGNEVHFSSGGLLTSRVDANGNTISYSYTSGLLTEITDPYNRDTTLSYTNGRLTSVTDFAGRTGSLSYDGSGRLESITQPDPDDTGPLAAPETSFTYDATSHQLTEVTDALAHDTDFAYGTHGRLTTITHPDNSTVSLTALQTIGLPTGTTGNTLVDANPSGTLTNERDYDSTFRTDPWGLLTEWTDPLNHSTLILRGPDGLPLQITLPDPDGAGGSQTSPVTRLGYDSVDDLVYQENPDGYTSSWTYTSTLHQVDTATDELGHSTSYGYDTAGNLTSVTDQDGYTTTLTYNGHGRVTSVTTPDPDGGGALAAAVTELAYDSYGRVATLTLPDDNTRTYTYNAADQLLTETDELSHTATMTYDALGRLTSYTDRESAETTYSYNAVGQLVEEVDALGNDTDYEYNNRGWLTTITYPDPDGAGSLGRPETEYGYDVAGNLTSMGQASFLSVPYLYTYDAADRRISMRRYSESESTTYEYDNLDRLITVTDVADAQQHYEYNWCGQVTSYLEIGSGSGGVSGGGQTPPGGGGGGTSSGEQRSWSYEYGPAGRLLQETDARGGITKYVYNARGLVTAIYAPDPDGNDPETSGPQQASRTAYDYDHAGRLVEVEDALLRSTTYQYNVRDLVTQVTLPDPDGAGGVSAPVVTMTYDDAGRVLTQTDPLGQTTTLSYDDVGRVLSVTGPDPDGAGSLAAPVESYTYNDLGSLLTRTEPGGAETTYQYDNLQRVTQVTEPDPDGAGALTSPVTTYAYGTNTLLSSMTDPLAGKPRSAMTRADAGPRSPMMPGTSPPMRTTIWT